jgi:hypothetical protein
MTDAPPSLDDRVAQLAARRAARAGLEAPTATGKRRTHAAATSRLIAASISTSAFFATIAALSTQTASGFSAARSTRVVVAGRPPASLAVTRPTVVVKTVHHKRFVDSEGRPIDASAIPESAVVIRASSLRLLNATTPASPPGPTAGAVAPVTAPRGTIAPAPYPVGAPPATTGPVHTPAPPPPPAPPPTPAPPPPPTTPPTTVHSPPPPPPPPPCTGSQC